MLNKIINFVIAFLSFSAVCFASVNDVYVNRWEVFTDLKNVNEIAVIDNKYAFCATTGGLYSVNLSNSEILRKYTNINGLLFNELTSIAVDNQKRLWIGASDGSICIYDFYNEKWKYIYDIKNSNENNKSINGFSLYNNYIFVATGYGIHKISTIDLSFVEAPYYQFGTFSSKTKVNKLITQNNQIFAVTGSGIAYANLINTNLNNPSSWSTYNIAPMNVNSISIEGAGNKVFAGSEAGFVYFDGTDWNLYPNSQINSQKTNAIKAIGNTLYFVSNSNVIFSADINSLPVISQYLISGNYLSLASDSQNLIAGTFESGIYVKKTSGYDYVYPNCPYRNIFDNVNYDDAGNIWAAAGTYDGGFYKYDGTTWTSYITALYPQIGRYNWFKKVVPSGSIIWAVGYGPGLTRIDGSNIKNYDYTNSNLPGIPEDSTFVALTGGATDTRGNFWTIAYKTRTGASLYRYNGDSIFLKYDNPTIISGSSARFTNIAIDNYDTKWITCYTPPGLYFFNENGTETNFTDDIYGFYSTVDFGVNEVTDVIVEKNNEVWVSTDNGIFMISNPLAAIQDPTRKPAPVKLGIISGNLRVPFTENCKCLHSDILNEKWIGTQNNGVFHLSSDGSTLIEQLSRANSPIITNTISSITVNKKTGKAYIGTEKGLFSYQTNAIEPVADFDKIICSPNPYVIPSPVDVRIDGLVEGSSIKILTLSGEIIKEFDSPGGRIATWNGLNKNGILVPSGIYIVVAFNKDASKVGKGKLAIVRK